MRESSLPLKPRNRRSMPLEAFVHLAGGLGLTALHSEFEEVRD